MMKVWAAGALAAALASAPLPLPPNWDRLLEDEPIEAACAVIVQPLIWQLSEDRRDQAATLLGDEAARLLTDAEAGQLLPLPRTAGQPAADAAFHAALDGIRRRALRATEGAAEQRYLARMIARFRAGTHREYRPYLVRSVALAGPPVESQPLLTAQYCDGTLVLTSMFFADTIPQTRRVPTIIFLPSEPLDIDAYMTVSS